MTTATTAGPVGRLAPDRCSMASLARGDRLEGTAVPQPRWLLIEQPGPWGRTGLSQSRFDQSVLPDLLTRCDTESVRPMLVRRTGRHPERHGGLLWGVVDTRPGSRGVHWSVREDDREIVDAPWDSSLGPAAERPVYLVCAHAGRDACCAVKGRPLAASLPVDDPTDVWECSHTGGDRFAANLVVLPLGDVYGRVPADGSLVLHAVRAGQVEMSTYRGRIGLSPAAQVAQVRARQSLGILGVDALPVLSQTVDGDVWTVTLGREVGPVEVVLRRHTSEVSALLTCHAARPAGWFTWELLELRA